MDTHSQKRMAARLLGIGVSRIRVSQDKEVAEALTRDDVRELIKKGAITALPAQGNPGGHRRHLLKQKGKGRRNKHGSRRGTAGARTPAKQAWMKRIRAQRRFLADVRSQMEPADYVNTYRRTKGGMFRNVSHVRFYLRERELLKRSRAAQRPAGSSAKTAAGKTAKPAQKANTQKPAKKE